MVLTLTFRFRQASQAEGPFGSVSAEYIEARATKVGRREEEAHGQLNISLYQLAGLS